MTSGYAHELIDIFFWEYTLFLQSLNDIREAIQIYHKSLSYQVTFSLWREKVLEYNNSSLSSFFFHIKQYEIKV